ncbi:hypothetical protein HBI56_123960 [Parastagonospora nodorum]|nr:hypothetical protein HBH51_127030 [Parastagonospora nodorum]KAH3989651.1 hypothetical protein HBH52_014880 [Parastagonospora nodorum]KAH4017203.1 hypothetical protein HBI09_198230 [Parastagonospora nodorum]KAH4057062.1 hypothetical protein HBH49_041250 [Parastagonospora nodorum]KAH4076738.1 hypothetical protein HBH50_009650 [Parastagonospora nodorum]
MDRKYDFGRAEAKAATFREAAEAVISNLNSARQKREDLIQQADRITAVKEEKRLLDLELEKIESSTSARQVKDRAATKPDAEKKKQEYRKKKEEKGKEIADKRRELENLERKYERDRRTLEEVESCIDELQNALATYRAWLDNNE